MNYFAPRDAAQRYAKGRPDVHSYSINQISSFLHLDGKLDRVLDIACGTGLSTTALLAIARQIDGTDISPQMLQHATPQDHIRYTLAAAESQPFGDGRFDLITVSSGVHWFDIDRFLAEANRLLKKEGHLILYENYFDSALQDDAAFADWCSHVHYQRFPSPPRNNKYDWKGEPVRQAGFRYLTEWRSSYFIPMTKPQFACYLTTQSNMIAQVEAGKISYEEADAWLDRELDPFFTPGGLPRNIRFGNWIKFLQKTG